MVLEVKMQLQGSSMFGTMGGFFGADCWKLTTTWQAVLGGAFLQDPSGIRDEGVEVEQLVHVLPTFC